MFAVRHLRGLATNVLAVSCAFLISSIFLTITAAPLVGDKEYVGKLEAELVPNMEDLEKVVFKPVSDLSKVKFATPLSGNNNVTGARLYHPPQDKAALLALLVEPEDGKPFLYADLNDDKVLTDDERFTFKHGEDDNPFLLETTLRVPLSNMPFQSFPIFVRYFKDVDWDELKEGERIFQQSTSAFARGMVDIEGSKTLVEYGYDGKSKKISASLGWIGVDGDGDGKILIHKLSPEAAEARAETVIFRAGQHYVSTKRVDVEKNEIVMRAHQASDYKRVELRVGSELPDFTFTDFNGKKRKLSEFRGKYVLVDFWASWCPPCREELPYLRAAYTRFHSRNFEILGMNNDDDISPVKSWLKSNDLTWTQATPESIEDVMRKLRITSFPTTLLLGPDGKIISLDQDGQPQLRGEELLKSLDDVLNHKN